MTGVTYSTFWGPNVDAYSLLDGKMPRRYAIKRVVNRDGFRALTALFNGLIGAASGSNVTATHTRISHQYQTSGAGVVEPGIARMTTITDINRNTTAADITALNEMVYNVQTRPVPYPADLSGNGGPALS